MAWTEKFKSGCGRTNNLLKENTKIANKNSEPDPEGIICTHEAISPRRRKRTRRFFSGGDRVFF